MKDYLVEVYTVLEALAEIPKHLAHDCWIGGTDHRVKLTCDESETYPVEQGWAPWPEE